MNKEPEEKNRMSYPPTIDMHHYLTLTQMAAISRESNVPRESGKRIWRFFALANILKKINGFL